MKVMKMINEVCVYSILSNFIILVLISFVFSFIAFASDFFRIVKIHRIVEMDKNRLHCNLVSKLEAETFNCPPGGRGWRNMVTRTS